jgi:uncharacterized membrane protein
MMKHIIFDIIGVTGLLMLGYGLWLFSPVMMYVLMGLLFVLFALLAEHGTIKVNLPKKKQEPR